MELPELKIEQTDEGYLHIIPTENETDFLAFVDLANSPELREQISKEIVRRCNRFGLLTTPAHKRKRIFAVYEKGDDEEQPCLMSGQATDLKEAFWGIHQYLLEHDFNEDDVDITID